MVTKDFPDLIANICKTFFLFVAIAFMCMLVIYGLNVMYYGEI